MFYYAFKVLLSAVLIVFISEISKRSTWLGAILASLPTLSILAMIWLYQDTQNAPLVAQLSQDIFWLVLPSLVFFIALPLFLRWKLSFYLSLSLSLALMIAAYYLMTLILKYFGLRA